MIGLTVIEIAVGAIFAIATTIWVEWLRKPRLELRIADIKDEVYKERPADKARYLGLKLVNGPLGRWVRWMSREAALQCHGTVTFHHLDGQNVFGRVMPIRWTRSPELVPAQLLTVDGKPVFYFDPSHYTLTPRIDIHPGDSERLVSG